MIFAFHTVTVGGDGSVDLGDVPVFSWFTGLWNYVFNDENENGYWDSGETAIPEQNVNIRWRDGTIYQAMPTDTEGFVPFDEIFPFFAWLVAEIDFADLKATGNTVVVDGGGPILGGDPWSYGGQLNPQIQSDGSSYRTATGPVLTEAFQGFLGQTSVIEWGKTDYGPDENGGISGMVLYATTRAEDDPKRAAAEVWEPGIPRVQVNLYQDADGDGFIDDQDGIDNDAGDVLDNATLADVDNYPFHWAPMYTDDPNWTGVPGPEDIDRNYPGQTPGTFDYGDAIAITTTDSWDDSLPTDCPGDNQLPGVDANDCFDGMRNWNQVRPGVFDGGYAFGPIYSIEDDFDGTAPPWITTPDPANPDVGYMASGTYIVESVPPPGYEIIRSQDRNVDFGDEFVPSIMTMAVSEEPYPEPVGEPYTVPAELSLFPGVEAPLAGRELRLADRKQIAVRQGRNAAVDFFMFTEVPIAGHITGFILDDTANEFDPTSPQLGEKYAPPWLPVSIRDWTGREINRVYSDQYGKYNALVPSTYTNNQPTPSGMSPNMITTCMNDPRLPNGEMDPNFNPQYSTFCYTFQYVPGATTYLDTPVLPVAAFAGPDQYPLDCEFADGTPKIYEVNGPEGGPYVSSTGEQISIVSEGTVAVPNPAYDGTNAKTIDRDYGFGSQGSVTLGGVPLTIGTWTETQINATIPDGAETGQLVVTRANGKSTVMGVTVTVGQQNDRFAVVRVPAGASIQEAIDDAQPGDLILVAPGLYNELVILWKPVQLQGYGAGSTTISAVKTPAEKLQLWRQKIEELYFEGAFDLLPSQEVGFDGIEPVTLFNEEGPGVIVLASDTNINQGGFGMDNRTNRSNARIDGFTISGADHAGGIVVNGYAHYLEIGNNRIMNNSGVFGGGVRLGHPTLTDETNQGGVYQNAYNDHIRIHHNQITRNGSLNGVGGGVAICTGSDAYEVTDNVVCGNFSMGGGGGIGHFGLSPEGLIASNRVVFNESFNQGRTVNGGGILIAGGTPLGGPGTLSPGAGSVTIIDNLIQGNAANAGDGGGIRTSRINGQDVEKFGNNPDNWYEINLFNNMIVNNLAALAGGGISMYDTASINIIHNTIAHNDSTATASEAFDPNNPNVSVPQPAGIVSRAHSPELIAAFGNQGGQAYSEPVLIDDIIWKNRTFYLDGDPTVPRYELAAGMPEYWDIGILGVDGTYTLNTQSSILTGDADPGFLDSYFNEERGVTVAQPEPTTALQPTIAFDEGGNFIRVRFGPLTLVGDYHIGEGSALDAGTDMSGSWSELAADYDGDPRPYGENVDIGADELWP